MLALTYPDGARVQRCDYLPENLQISPLFIESVSPRNEIESNHSKSRNNDYVSRFRRRLERRGSVNRNRNRNRLKNYADIKNNEENYAKVAEFSSSSSSSNSILRSLPLCGFRCDESSINDDDEEEEDDPVFKFRESSQSETSSHCRKNNNYNNDDDDDNENDTQRFKIYKNLNEDEKLSSKTRRRELPGRESWPGGRHPKDRCFLQLLLIIILSIIIGYNKHCGHFGSRMMINRNTAFGVFTIGTTFFGRVNTAPVDIVTDTGVRSERSANLSHITGTSRKIQMFIKNRHLQILPDGTVNGSNDDTSDYTILQRASVSRGQLRIQGVATCLYLCMDSCGLLYGSREFTEDCVFNETLEQHNYNTYSSAHWSTPKKTLYLGLSRYGQPRRVQAPGHNLGRLSGYARVLTKVVAQDRVEGLHRRMMGARHNVRHHHGSQQTICPAPTPQEKDGRDKFRCRKRKKRKKRRRKCRAGEIPGPQCDVRDISGVSGTGHHPSETQSKRSCEGAAVDEACRREALETPAKKRKSRIEADDDNLQGKGDIDDLQDEDIIVGDGKSRRSNIQLDRGLRKKGNKKSPTVNGKKSAGAGKRNKKLNNNKNDRNLGKNLRKRGNHQSGRSVRTTNRLSSHLSPTSTMMPISLLSSKPMMTNEKLLNLERENSDEILIDDRPKSLSSSSSSSAVSAVSLAATSLASTLTLTAAVVSGEIFTEDHHGTVSASTASDIKTENILDLDEFVDVNKDFVDEDDDDDERDDDDEEIKEDTRITDLANYSIPKNHHPVTERRLAM